MLVKVEGITEHWVTLDGGEEFSIVTSGCIATPSDSISTCLDLNSIYNVPFKLWDSVKGKGIVYDGSVEDRGSYKYYYLKGTSDYSEAFEVIII